VKYACGLTLLSLQVSTRDAMQAQFSAPSSLPAKRLFFLDKAIAGLFCPYRQGS
jgi:hypothetical protein